MTSHDADERVCVVAMLEIQQKWFDRTSVAMTPEVDHLRGSWSSGAAQQFADHEARRCTCATTGPRGSTACTTASPRPQDVAQGRVDASAAGSSPASGRPGAVRVRRVDTGVDHSDDYSVYQQRLARPAKSLRRALEEHK